MVSVQARGLSGSLEQELRKLLSDQLSTLEHNFMMACVEVLSPIRELELQVRKQKESGEDVSHHNSLKSGASQESYSTNVTAASVTDRRSITGNSDSFRSLPDPQDVEDITDYDAGFTSTIKPTKRSRRPEKMNEDSDEEIIDKPKNSPPGVLRSALNRGKDGKKALSPTAWNAARLSARGAFDDDDNAPVPRRVSRAIASQSAFAPEDFPARLEVEDGSEQPPTTHVSRFVVPSVRLQSRLKNANNKGQSGAIRIASLKAKTVVVPMEGEAEIIDHVEIRENDARSMINHNGSLTSSEKISIRSGSNAQSLMRIEFALQKVWEGDDKPLLKAKSGLKKIAGSPRLTQIMWPTRTESLDHCPKDEMTTRQKVRKACNRACIVSPNSSMRVLWDLLSTIFIGYEVVATPLQFFDLDESGFTKVWAWISRLFWTFDMPITLCTGIAKPNGDIDMRRTAIVKKYIKTWLIIDIFVVGSDWAEFFMSAGSEVSGGTARLTKAFRVMRIVRMVRLLRVGRLPEIMERLGEKLPHEITNFIRAAGSVFKTLGFIVMLSHTIACIWYGVGDQDSGQHWVPYFGLHEEPIDYQYMTALHWSVTQFTGSMEINPRNTGERLFAVVTLIFAFMVATIFVSSLTSSMTQYYIVSSRQTKMVLELRRYLTKNKVSASLAARLQRNAHFAIKEMQQNVQEDEVEVMRYVSEPLRQELHVEIYYPILEAHPFFARCYQEIPSLTRKLCHTSVSLIHFSEGDTLFVCGEDPDPPEMLFVRTGRLQYYQGSDPLFVEQDLSTNDVLPGQWMCESVLWIQWQYVGDLVAATDGQLMQVHAKRFQELMTQGTEVLRPKRYAQAFKQMLSSTPLLKLTDIGSADQVKGLLRSVHGTSELSGGAEGSQRITYLSPPQ